MNFTPSQEQDELEESDIEVDVSKEDAPVEEPREKAVQEAVFVDKPKDFMESSGFVADTEDDKSDVLEDVSVKIPKT